MRSGGRVGERRGLKGRPERWWCGWGRIEGLVVWRMRMSRLASLRANPWARECGEGGDWWFGGWSAGWVEWIEGALWLLLVKTVVMGGWWAGEERYVGSFGSASWSSMDSGGRGGEWG